MNSQMQLESEPHVDDPVVFLKQFFKKKEFKPTKRRFKPPQKLSYKPKKSYISDHFDAENSLLTSKFLSIQMHISYYFQKILTKLIPILDDDHNPANLNSLNNFQRRDKVPSLLFPTAQTAYPLTHNIGSEPIQQDPAVKIHWEQ